MGMTRRSFLGSAAGGVTMALPFDMRLLGRGQPSPTALLDLREDCLGEAAAGYEAALAGLGTRFTRAEPPLVTRCATLIVPAALTIPSRALRTIAASLTGGATVLLECGAGFAAEPVFRAYRAALRDSLQIHIDAPVHLWSGDSPVQRVPYVDYTWPSSAKVRDFSRVVPLARQGESEEIIAWVDGLPVALKRRRGSGTLIFLGSPLGPALWAGDAEARRWLFDVLVRPGVAW